MKGNLLFAIFILVLVALGGALLGANIQSAYVDKQHTGAVYTGIVIGISVMAMSGVLIFLEK